MNPQELARIANLAQEAAERESVVSELLGVYVFGSTARGTVRPESDLDIGFLFREPSYVKDPVRYFGAAQRIGAHIGRTLGTATDVLILNGTSLELAYEVIAHGICCYSPNVDARLEREAALRGMYFDSKPFLTQLRRRYVERGKTQGTP
ncbi:MAG: nucleotidyltransferase domain-containing protein [Desulfosoma sp.]